MMKRVLCLILCLAILFCGCAMEEKRDISEVLSQTADALLAQVPQPGCSSVGGEWTVLGMARLGAEVPDGWFEGYRDRLESHVTACGGVLHERKYTEYSRVVLAVTAMGADAGDVSGYDLTAPLQDLEQTAFQGVNGAIYGLLALSSGSYAEESVLQSYVSYILEKELPGGGWTMMGGEPEADLTAMALQTLAQYQDREDVAAAVERGLEVLSNMELKNCESLSQTIVALCELGIDTDDKRFERDGKNLTEQLLDYQTEEGMFRHTMETEGDLLATEQAFYALVSMKLAKDGGSLYRMGGNTCTLEIRCDTLLSNLDRLPDGKSTLVPENGILLSKTTVNFSDGETVFDVFRRCLREEKIHFEYVDAKAYGSVYIEGIGNLYEYDCGEQSGWMFSVNGIFPGLGCSSYTVSDGDEIVFAYTCDLGADLGAEK